MRFLVAVFLVLLVVASCDPAPVAAPTKAPPPPRLIPPLWDAEVDEWVRLEPTDGSTSIVYRVVNAGDTWVDVETTSYVNGNFVGSPQKVRWKRNCFGLPEDECVIRAFDPDRIEVDGKSYDCWRILAGSATVQQMYWISDAIPVHGVLRVANVHKGDPDLKNALILKAWGNAVRPK